MARGGPIWKAPYAADFGRIGPITGCQDQAVVQLLRSQGAARGAGELARIGLTGMRLAAGTLVRKAARDRSNQEFQVEVVGDELTDQLVKQFRMARRIVRGTQAVNRVDQADAEEVMPQAIDGGPGEPRIIRGA